MSKASNVTKYDAGGSNDNIISDGYIKTVEKVWMDNYTLSAVVTTDTIQIAIIPSNKKITSIEVMIETTLAQTDCTIRLGHQADAEAFIGETELTTGLTVSTIKFPMGQNVGNIVAQTTFHPKMTGFQEVTSGTTGNIILTLDDWVASTGTIKTIVRYT